MNYDDLPQKKGDLVMFSDGSRGTSQSSADQEEMLLLALLLAQELGRQRHGIQVLAALYFPGISAATWKVL